MDKLLAHVVEKIKPSEEEIRKEEEFIKGFLEKLRKILPKNISVELAGSIAKKTNLKDDRDFDFFLLFPTTYSKKDLATLGLEYAKKAVEPHKWDIGYAEHPYLRAKMGEYEVDIVPSFKILYIEEKASSVDRSPLHTRYVLEKLSEKQRDDVRLLKCFFKCIGVYGSELRIEGFSGYLCELLIINYGSFKNLISEMANWDEVVIDLNKEYHFEEAREKFKTPLIVIDPVDKRRNVAAVVSKTSLTKSILAAQAFLKNPKEEFFFEQKPPLLPKKLIQRKIEERGTSIIYILFPNPPFIPDVLWPQLRKTAKTIVKHVELNGFKIFEFDSWSNGKECLIILEFEVASLPKVKNIPGPDISYRKEVEKFIKKHKNPIDGHWIKNGKVVVVERREWCKAEELISDIIKKPKKYGIPNKIAPFVTKSIIEKTIPNEFIEFLSQYFMKRPFYI